MASTSGTLSATTTPGPPPEAEEAHHEDDHQCLDERPSGTLYRLFHHARLKGHRVKLDAGRELGRIRSRSSLPSLAELEDVPF